MAAARRWTVPALMTLALLLPAASPAGPPDAGPGDRGRSKKDDKKKRRGKPKAAPKNLAVKAMRLVIEEAVFEDMTFAEFADWLARTTKANVVVRWKVLEKAGVERDCPINIKRKNTTIRKLLTLVFDQVTEDLPTIELAAKADGNTLLISTREEINAKRFARVYDIQDLLHSIPNFKGIESGGGEEDPEDKRANRLRLKRLRAEQLRRERGKRGKKERKIPSRAYLLMDIITTHIQPLSWKVNGGKGTIVFYKGKLVVYNNIEVHQQIGGAITPRADKK